MLTQQKSTIKVQNYAEVQSMNYLAIGYYALSGKVLGKLPYKRSAEVSRRAARHARLRVNKNQNIHVPSH